MLRQLLHSPDTLPSARRSSSGYRTISLITSLPAELLDNIYSQLPLADRYCFALACKHFIRYAFNSPTFLTTTTSINPLKPSYRRQNPLSLPTPSNIPRTAAFRDLIQALSRGWCPSHLHWCDNCRSFRRFPPETRELWYSGGQRDDLPPDTTFYGGKWRQDIGVSCDGEVCWNHFCPECVERRCSVKAGERKGKGKGMGKGGTP
jgi:hypothetical protein